MHELIVNIHMHTIYSDGSGTHKEIAGAALETGVDVVIVTDHNVFVRGMEGYHQQKENRLLMLIGEEVHDVTRSPQKNHLLVLGAGREMSTFASKPQQLVDQVLRAKGLAFIAHPYDPELKAFGEDDISWVDWDVRGFTGIELWNGLSEFKSVARGYLDGIFYALFPQYLARGPHPKTLKKWDELTAAGQRIVAVAGSDAHALKKGLGPIHCTIYPYTFHFQAINNHLLVDHPLTGDLASDRKMILDSLKKGNNYLGYDLPAPTRGFRFTAQGKDGSAIMGDEIRVGNGVTLQIRIPEKTECRLICDGEVIRTWRDREICAHIVSKPGVYRVECLIEYLGRSRGWIYSNPIYIRP